jgi:hypothetical protein
MSRETDSALTPEEWQHKRVAVTWGVGSGNPALTSDGLMVESDGSLSLQASDDGEWCEQGIDARKVMALANLSLTLENKPSAIRTADVEVCISAAWYFRKLARELISHAEAIQDANAKSAFLDHARSLTAGNIKLFELSNTLRRLVPPQ